MTGTIRIGHDDQLLRCHVPHEPVQNIVANPPAFPAIPGGPVRRLAADQPHSGTRTRGHVPLRDGIQAQPVQAKQDPTIERARLNTKPRGFIHFFNHTPNQTARPLHTKMRRAGIQPMWYPSHRLI